jgi:CheY-like chemotaxis protein
MDPRNKPLREQKPEEESVENRAFAELLSKGTEEIQDHLSLVAQIQVRIGHLLETSIEELERAQRLETLTGIIAGTDLGRDAAGEEGGPASGGPRERPGVYLEREIKSLKKMQKLLGVHLRPAGEAVRQAAGGSLAPEPAGEAAEADTPNKILLIYHDPGTVRILRYFLEKENYEVHISTNGAEGLKKAAQERPDIVLLDVLLPAMDGYQVLNRLKRDERTAAIPVFVLSVLSQETDILKAIEAGAADYFVKPFSPQIIIAKIRRVLRSGRG